MEKMKKTDELVKMLQDGVREIQDSDNYRKYLKIMSSFPEYSSRNTLLIFQQCPNASYVAGYQTWKNRYGRQVRKGEKAIRILAPYTYKSAAADADEANEMRTGFRKISVFDISQTDGKPLPELIEPDSLNQDVTHYQELFDGIRSAAGFEMIFDDMESGRKGACRYWDQTIRIQKDMPQLQTIKTMVHETAHSILHDPYLSEESEFQNFVLENATIREIEAESVAFVVCSHFGLDCSEYSFPYVAGWKQQSEFFEESLSRIQKTADHMITEIRKHLPESSAWMDAEQLSQIGSRYLIPHSGCSMIRF